MYLGFFNGNDSFLKGTQDGQTQFYTVKKKYPATNMHINQSFVIVGSQNQMDAQPARSSYQTQFVSRENVSSTKQTFEDQTIVQKREKYHTTSVHAKDWRRLAPLSPTYAKTPFKILDNMLKPDCKSTTSRAKTPIKTREQQRAELDGIADEHTRRILLNRLQIWGTLNEDEL